MRIVIAGLGDVGYRLAEKLMVDHDVIVIEKDPEKIKRAGLDVVTIKGNAANLSVLKNADISRADIFLALTGDDEVNFVSGLAAKRFGVQKVIIRVNNPEYVDKPVVRDHMFGYDAVICPYLSLANEIARVLTIPGAVEVITLSNGKLEMVELLITQSSEVDGRKLSELNLPREVIVAIVYRDGDLVIPKGDFVLKNGDRIAIIGKKEEIEKITEVFGSAIVKKVVIFGAGVVGSYIAKTLKGVKIKVFDPNPKKCSLMSEELSNLKVICGDFTDIKLLRDEEVGSSDAVVAVADKDETNLLIGLISKTLGVKKVVAKVERIDYVDLFRSVGIDAFCSKSIIIDEILKLLNLKRSEILDEFGNVAVIELKNEKVNKKVGDLKLPKNSIIGAIIRGDECLVPKGDTEIIPGDNLLIFVDRNEVEEIEKVFR